MDNKKIVFEVCCGSLRSVAAAVAGGAERIELCSALSLDGLTPSLGLVKTVREMWPSLRMHVLIRPREGDFVYTPAEIEVMLQDIAALLPYSDGFVGGVLTAEGDIDTNATRRLVQASGEKAFTFHRAFDVCLHPHEALQQIIGIGCKRLLTSGQEASAFQGEKLIGSLVDEAKEQIIIMPGGGVSARNVAKIVHQTGVCEIHGSAKAGGVETSSDEVKKIIKILSQI